MQIGLPTNFCLHCEWPYKTLTDRDQEKAEAPSHLCHKRPGPQLQGITSPGHGQTRCSSVRTLRPPSRDQPHSVNQRGKRKSFSKTQLLWGSSESNWYFTDACRRGQEGPWDREPGVMGSVPVLTLPRARARPRSVCPSQTVLSTPLRTDTRHCFLRAVPTLHSPLGKALHISKCFPSQKPKLFILQLGK